MNIFSAKIIRTNYQDLIKIIAILSMLIDHLGLFIFPSCIEMRIIGRIAMPIFCFCAGYNFHDKIRIEVILGAIFVTIINISLHSPYNVNILISISLGLLYLKYIYPYNSQNMVYLHILILLLLAPLSRTMFDYGTLGVIIMIIGHMAQNHRINFKNSVFVSLILALSNVLIFWQLTLNYNILVITFFCLLYKLMTFKDFSYNINYKILLISRYSLSIYILNILLMQIVYIS